MPPLFPPVANPLLPPQQEQLQFAPIPAPLQAPQGEQRNEKMANIGGLLLNVLGALSGAGAAGNGLLSQGQQIQEQRAKREGQMATLQSREAIAEKMNPQGKQIRNKDARGVFGERLAQRDIEGAEQVLNAELSRQRMEDAERDRGKKEDRWAWEQDAKAQERDAGRFYETLKASLDPSVDVADELERAAKANFTEGTDAQALKNKMLIALAKKKIKLTPEQRNSLMLELDKRVSATEAPGMLEKLNPWAEPRKPLDRKAAFDGFAKSIAGEEAHAKQATLKQQMEDAAFIRANVRSQKKDVQEKVEAAKQRLFGGAPAQQAPAAAQGPSQEQIAQYAQQHGLSLEQANAIIQKRLNASK
jgi:hypothetical protein